MRALILYSQHETGQQAHAQILASQLGAYASPVDVLEVYGSALGRAMLDLLAVREFPAAVFVQDHLAGVSDAAYIAAAADEQMDIESREFRGVDPGRLRARLEAAIETGREEIRQAVREAASEKPLDAQAVEAIFEAETRQRRSRPAEGGARGGVPGWTSWTARS